MFEDIYDTTEYLVLTQKGYVESVGHNGIFYVQEPIDAFLFPDLESANEVAEIVNGNVVCA